MDTYINIVGGLRLDEPAADLAIAMALTSSLKDTPLSDQAVAFGEIGLSGEIRAVSHAESRVSEAARLGFTRCVLPAANLKSIAEPEKYPIQLFGVRTIREAFEALEK